MQNGQSVFEQLQKRGDKALEILRKQAYNPKTQKHLRTWGISDVSKMVSRTSQYIRQQEKENRVPLPERINNKRAYTLKDINNLRDYFGTRPIRLENSDTSVIAFTNFKGGAAKTTSAVHCAQDFAQKGYRVLFIDGDSQGSATQIFGYNPDDHISNDATLLPFLTGQSQELKDVIRDTYWPGLDLIPANLALYNAEFVLPVENTKAKVAGRKFEVHNILAKGIAQVELNYDIIIIDCPPSMGMISINAVFAANALIIPIPPAMLDFTSTIQFFAMLNEVLELLPEKSFHFVRLLITKHEGRKSNHDLVTIIRKLFGDFVMSNMMSASEAIRKASSEMKTLFEVEKYDGTKATIDRALHITREVNSEIEHLIKDSWNSSVSSVLDSNEYMEGVEA